MGLDIILSEVKEVDVFSRGITHNLCPMAEEAGIYKHLWLPGELGVKQAKELIEPLEKARALLLSDRKRFEAFNAKNGWGTYDDFMLFIQDVLDACRDNPYAKVSADR